MKKPYLSLIFILSLTPSFAQIGKPLLDISGGHKQVLFQLLARNQPTEAPKSTGLMERWIGFTMRDNTTTPATLLDSASLKYSGGRGSVFNHFIIAYTMENPYSKSPIVNYEYQVTKPQVLCDTNIIYDQDPVTNLYGLFLIRTYQYDAGNNLVSSNERYSDSAMYQNCSYFNSFGATGNINQAVAVNHNAGVNDSNSIQYFTYDASGNIIKDSIFLYSGTSWTISSKCNYTYDAANNLLKADYYAYSGATGWSKTEQYINTYDASNRLLTVFLSDDKGLGLQPDITDTFSYTPGVSYVTGWKEYAYKGSYWQKGGYVFEHITSAGVADTEYSYGLDGSGTMWVPSSYAYTTYTPLKNPLQVQIFDFNGTSYNTKPSVIEQYYYEEYSPAAVEQNLAYKDNAKLYPNPTTGQLTIVGLTVQQNEKINVNVMNLSGQVLSTTSVHWNGVSQLLNISTLAAGNYWVVINSANGNLLHTEEIVKQ